MVLGEAAKTQIAGPSRLTAVRPSEMLRENSKTQAGINPSIAATGPSPRLRTELSSRGNRSPKMMKRKATGMANRTSWARSRVRIRQSLTTIAASTGWIKGSAPLSRCPRTDPVWRRRGGTAWIQPARYNRPLRTVPTAKIAAAVARSGRTQPIAESQSPLRNAVALRPAHPEGSHGALASGMSGNDGATERRVKPESRSAGLSKKLSRLIPSASTTPNRVRISRPLPIGMNRTSSRLSSEMITTT